MLFVLIIGFVFPKQSKRTEALERDYQNIQFLGKRDYSTLPSYLEDFSVAIIPFKIYGLTESVNPTKFYEYCAGGKPIVTTALRELEIYQDSIGYAHNHQEFLESLSDIVILKTKTQNINQLRDIAKENSWDKKVQILLGIISKFGLVGVQELKASSPLVSIIVVNYNGKKYLNECLTSLLNQTYRNFEIILVDNKSSDDSVKFVQSNFGNRILVTQNDTNLGFAAGCNIGIKISKGSLIALFNQDAIADKEWLSTLVYVVQSAEEIAAAAGKVYYWGDKYGKDVVFCTWSKVDPYTAGAYNFYKGDEPISKVDYLTGAAMLVKKEVIDKIGLLDPEYFLYFDETEWCARMIRASYDLVYVPQAVTWHVVSASLSDSNLKSISHESQ